MRRQQAVTFGPPPAHPYSVAVRADGLIYLAGALAVDAAGAPVRGDIGTETRLTLERLARVLGAAGSSLAQVLSVTVYLTDAADFAAMNAVYRQFWPEAPPARTTVITGLVAPGARIEITMIAAPDGAPREVIHPGGWRASPNPYSYAIASGETLFLAGLVARRGRDNQFVPGDVQAQVEVIFENAAEILGAAGLTLAHVVSSRVYLTDAGHFGAMNEVYRRHFAGDPPVRATVQAALAGPEALVEMTFVASRAGRQAVGTPPAGIPLSPAVRAGARLYLSGMLGNTPDTEGDVAAQTRATLARVDDALRAAGAAPADVVDATVFLTDPSAFATMNAEYRAWFQEPFPARTTVVTPLVAGDALVEIMVTAVTPAGA